LYLLADLGLCIFFGQCSAGVYPGLTTRMLHHKKMTRPCVRLVLG